MYDDRKSWSIKEAEIMRELRGILDLTAEECALLKSLEPAAREAAPRLVAEFYERLLAHELTREFIVDKERLGNTLATGSPNCSAATTTTPTRSSACPSATSTSASAFPSATRWR